jgi:Divergent InlB B-repeat domain
LNITVSGEGSVTPALKSSQVAVGKSFTLTATPAKGWLFEGWSTIGLGNSVNTGSPVLPFTFTSNTLITANFIPNPFGSLKGVYDGLFFGTNEVNPGSSGFFTLSLTPGGSFSGRLLMGPVTYNFSSQFSSTGGAQVLAKSGQKSLTLNLQLDTSGQTGQIVGQVNGASWSSPLVANASPLASRYTMAMQWGSSGGDGYGTGTLSPLGVLNVAGTLADGTTFSATAPVSKGGQWPFYSYAPAGNDTVLGWVSVGDGLNGANITWTKTSGKSLYKAGFTNTISLIGSTWEPPTKNSPALSLSDPSIVLSGGGLSGPLTLSVGSQSSLTYGATGVSLTINQLTGSFSGWFDNPATGRKQTVSGVVLQNMGQAYGLFQGTNESGAVSLQSQ